MLCPPQLCIWYAYLPVQLKKRQLLPLAMLYRSIYCIASCPTISSLHIGQTRRELAAAAAWAEPCSSRATRDVRSSFSVDMGVLDVCELNDTELSEGDSRPICLGWGGAVGGAARPLPLPSTRPPPRLRRAAMTGIMTSKLSSFDRDPCCAGCGTATSATAARWTCSSSEVAKDLKPQARIAGRSRPDGTFTCQ